MRILLFVFLGLLIQPSYSQELRGKKRTCRVIFPERPNDAPKSAFLFDGEESREVSLPSMNFSPVIEVPAGARTLLLTSSPVVDPENPPEDVPSLRIGEGVGDFYILITPDRSKATLPVQMRLVDTGGGKLKAGETLWFNLTEHRIVAKLGSSRMSVDPKGRTVSKDPIRESGYYIAEFGYQPQGEGEFRRVTEQQWWHDARSRHIGFIVASGGRLPKIFFYRDYRAKDTGAATDS